MLETGCRYGEEGWWAHCKITPSPLTTVAGSSRLQVTQPHSISPSFFSLLPFPLALVTSILHTCKGREKPAPSLVSYQHLKESVYELQKIIHSISLPTCLPSPPPPPPPPGYLVLLPSDCLSNLVSHRGAMGKPAPTLVASPFWVRLLISDHIKPNKC